VLINPQPAIIRQHPLRERGGPCEYTHMGGHYRDDSVRGEDVTGSSNRECLIMCHSSKRHKHPKRMARHEWMIFASSVVRNYFERARHSANFCWRRKVYPRILVGGRVTTYLGRIEAYLYTRPSRKESRPTHSLAFPLQRPKLWIAEVAFLVSYVLASVS